MKQRDVERRVREASWPEPPGGLRARVLSTPVAAGRVTWSDRVWFSRTFRVAAAAVVAAALAIASWPESTRTAPPTSWNRAQAQALDDLRLELDLPEALALSLRRRTTEPSPRAGDDRVHLAMLLVETAGDWR